MRRFEDLTEREKALLEVAVEWFGYTQDEVLEDIDNLNDDYLVLTEEKADEYALERIKDLIDDCGIECMQNIDLSKYVDEDYFRQIFEESYYSYAEDIANEPADSDEFENRLDEEMNDRGCKDIDEFVGSLMNDIADFIEEYKFQFGDDSFNEIIKNNNLIDLDGVANEVLEIDGRGYTISTYDGVEYEQTIDGTTYYVYRTN